MSRTYRGFWLAQTVLLLVTLLVLASGLHSWGQNFPGEKEPIGANRLIQFPDDELAIISFTPVGAGNVPLWIQEFSPDPAYNVPAGPTSTAPQPWPQALEEENIFSNAGVTKGRFVDPTRDAMIALTKTSVEKGQITWAVQEITFVNGPTGTVPTYTFTAPVVPPDSPADDSFRSADSPGAIAGGDLDRVVDEDGNAHDEIVMVTEFYPGGNLTQVALSVIDYAVRPGEATVNATVIGLPGAPMAYPLNISTLRHHKGRSGQAGRPRYPGMLAVTTGDFDGDDTKDIAVVALTFDPKTGNNNLQVHFYKYEPGYTQDPPTHGSLTHMGFQSVADGPDDPTKQGAFFHGPLSVDRGDVDNDGKDEVIVAFLDDAQTQEPGPPGEDLEFWADVYLATVAFDPTSHTITLTKENLSTTVEAWYDGLNDSPPFNPNPPPHYQDIRVAAGLFKFNPEQGYPLTRRQIALAYVNDTGKLQLELWEQLPPQTPGFHRYADVAWDFCLRDGQANSFSLVAGNFAGVKAKQSDNTPPVWGLAVAYESATQSEGVVASVFRVDQDVDWDNGVFPLKAVSRLTVPKLDAECARNSRNVLVAFDYDGDSLYLGPPVHFVLNDVHHFDYLLQEPPKHVDYLPNAITTCGFLAYACNGITNVSEFDGFNIAYGTSATNTVSHEVRKNSSWSAGGSVAFSAQNTVGEDAGIENFDITVDFRTKVGYDYDEHKESYTGQESSYTVTQESATSADDALSFQIRTTDIWRYRIYGASQTDQHGQTINGFYEIALPRALCTASGSTDPTDCTGQGVISGGKAHMELYQPWHENWNILSYPNADTEFQPTDIGSWTRASCGTNHPQCSDTGCTPNKDDSTQVDCTKPLAPPKQFSWDGTESKQTIQLDSSLTTGSTTEWTSKFSEDVNVGIGWKFSSGFLAVNKFSGCLDFDFHSEQSWGQLSTASTTTTLTSDITLNKPSGDGTLLYNFFPTLYVDTKGTMRAVHSVTTPTIGFWNDFYRGVDPALNLPKKFSDAPDPNFKQFNVGSDAKEMRGFLLRNGKADSAAYGTVLACGPVTLDDPALNNQVLLEARIYNYSVSSTVSDVPVRFDVVELDENGEECRDATACLTRTPLATVTATCTNPYNVSATDCVAHGMHTLPPRGMGLAQYTLDISTLPLPSVGPSNPFRFYVVVDPDNTIAEETHEWRQPTVVLTPDLHFDPDEQFCVDVQGTSAERICYTVQSGADDITQALTDAINRSQTAVRYGLKAAKIKFDQSNPNESARVIAGAPHVEITLPNANGGAQLKPGTEFRAGFLDKYGRPFYFVPATTNLTATNDQPGQNNEGYGARTLMVRVPAAVELLGGGDPCGGGAGLDLYMASESLAATDRDGTTHTGRVRVTPGQSLRLQFTAFADSDTTTCEQTQLFLGDPTRGGTHLATRMISGVDAVKGGRTWHPWRAPDTPGLYTLHAHLHERPTDTQVGNNRAKLEVLVVDPNNPNGAVVSKFEGTARHLGSERATGTVSLSGAVVFSGALDLSAATLTLSQLLNEQNGNGELTQGAHGSGFLPLTLLPARHGRQGTWATFTTQAGAEPRVRARITRRPSRQGDTQDEWGFILTAERMLIDAAADCHGAPKASTELTTQLTLSDGTHLPLVIQTTQPWRCRKKSLRTP